MIDINISKVNKSFGFDKILNNIDLTINRGDKIALIGTNGCGKSTLLKIVGGIESVNSGEVSIRKGAVIGYLSQIPENNDVIVKEYIYDIFKELVQMKEKLGQLEKNLSNNFKTINKYSKLQQRFIDLGGYEINTKVSKVLNAFSITDEMLNRNFNTL